MTVYVCQATRGECCLADTCAIHRDRSYIHGEVHVMFFISDRKGESCPHFMAYDEEDK